MQKDPSQKQTGMPHEVVMGVATFAALAIGFVAYLIIQRTFFGKPSTNMDPKEWRAIKLKSRKELSPNVYINVFELDNKDKPLGLPTGRHIQMMFKNGSEQVSRSYTPSEWRMNGEFDLVYKVYEAGKMTNFLKKLPIGNTINIRGPTGRMEYKGSGVFERIVRKKPVQDKYSSMILLCGGTGLTPMLQIAKHVLSDPKDKTMVYMLFANSTVPDVILREYLEEMQKEFQAQFKLTLAVSRPGSDSWPHFTGRFNAKALQKMVDEGKLPKPTKEVGSAICGPPGFEKAMAQAVKEVGFGEHVKTMRW